MKTYEIVLTDDCTRKCSFCYVKNTGYYETKQNIQNFLKYVIENQSPREAFEVNIFGGEPLLYFQGIKTVVTQLLDLHIYWDIRFNVITNGDLLTDEMIEFFNEHDVHIGLSTYDIFKGETYVNRYVELYNKLKHCHCLFTLTSETISRYFELKYIYKLNNLKHSIHFSHSPDSWKDFDLIVFKTMIQTIFSHELYDYAYSFNENNKEADNFIGIYLARYVQSVVDPNMIQTFCTTEDKISFYKGKIVGPCMRGCNLKKPVINDICKHCEYNKCCTRGCFAEIVNGMVNVYLCEMEAVRFETVKKFINSNLPVIDKIKKYYVQKAFCLV